MAAVGQTVAHSAHNVHSDSMVTGAISDRSTHFLYGKFPGTCRGGMLSRVFNWLIFSWIDSPNRFAISKSLSSGTETCVTEQARLDFSVGYPVTQTPRAFPFVTRLPSNYQKGGRATSTAGRPSNQSLDMKRGQRVKGRTRGWYGTTRSHEFPEAVVDTKFTGRPPQLTENDVRRMYEMEVLS